MNLFIQGIYFFSFFLGFQLIEFTVNDRATLLLGANAVTGIYSIGIICTSLGFICYALIHRFIKTISIRQIVLLINVLFTVISCFVTFNTLIPSHFIVVAFLSLLGWGYMGGSVHYSICMNGSARESFGRIVGISSAIAVAVQFLIQKYFLTNQVLTLTVFTCGLLLIALTIKYPAGNLVIASEVPSEKGKGIKLILAVAFMTAVVSMIDGIVVNMNALGTSSVLNYTRLFYCLSLIIAGFVADYQKGRFFSAAVIAALFLSTVSAGFLSTPYTYTLAMSCMYFYCGFYVVFFTVSFFAYARESVHSSVWTGMGRIVRGIVTAMLAIPMERAFDVLGNGIVVAGSFLFSVVTLLLLFRDVLKTFYVSEIEKVERIQYSTDELINLFAEQYAISEREKEVLCKLLFTEDGVQEIADSLFISRRNLQRYISSLYTKTNTQTRTGLYRAYADFEKLVNTGDYKLSHM